MDEPAMPADEMARLAALDAFRIVGAEQGYFATIVEDLRAHFRCDIAAIDFIEADRQWALAAVGAHPGTLPREVAFCAHAIRSDAAMLVPDTLVDERFCKNPLVTGPPYIRAYAGAPLTDRRGHRLGAVCVIDGARLPLAAGDIAVLRDAAYRVMRHLELHQIRQTERGPLLPRLLADADRSQASRDGRSAALDVDVLRAFLDEQEAEGSLGENRG